MDNINRWQVYVADKGRMVQHVVQSRTREGAERKALKPYPHGMVVMVKSLGALKAALAHDRKMGLGQ